MWPYHSLNINNESLSLSTYIISLVLFGCGGVRSSFSSIRPVIHPSKFLILEEEDDGRGGGRMAAAVYAAVKNFKRRKQVINK
jgi:hypothetical protein